MIWLQMKLDVLPEEEDSVTESRSSSRTMSTATDVSEFDPLTQSTSSTGSKVTIGKGDVDIAQLTGGSMSGSTTSLDSSSSNVSTPTRRKVGR